MVKLKKAYIIKYITAFMEDSQEIFLDDLVMETVNLEEVGNGPKDIKSALFLEKIGYAQKREYILDALKQKLPAGSRLPEGVFFVFTPNDGFIYRKSGDVIEDPGFFDINLGNGSLQEALDVIGYSARKRRAEGNRTELKALFYNHESKLKFERLLHPHGFSLSADIGVAYIEGRGNIMCHDYHN